MKVQKEAPRHTADCPNQFLWLPLVVAFFSSSTVSYADPVISNLDPNSAIAGGPSFTLRVNGAEFGGGNTTATVLWNGSARPTTRVNSSQLTAAIAAADIATARTVQVRVRVQSAGGGNDDDNGAETSNQVAFVVNNPIPSIISLNPTATSAGGPDFTLTVNGSNFVAGATVRFAGSSRSTTFVSSSRLTAAIPAADIATAGTASITVFNPGPRTSNALTFTISAPSLTITTGSSLPQGTVGSSYSQPLAASGGTPPYTWSVSSGSLPAGLVLAASNGTISGTPSATGNSSFTVRVLDNASVSATRQFQLSVGPATTPTFTLSGFSDNAEPAQQPSVEITLAQGHPSPITGQLTLKFTSNADVPRDDPSIQFSTGGRSINFSIPANTTRAVFSNGAPSIAFQTGTVSGTIELAVSGQSGAGTVMPPPSRMLTLSRRAPAITRLIIASRNSSGFELEITGFSTPRSLTQATVRFTAAQGANLETSILTLSLSIPAAGWFQSQNGTSLGGQFRLSMPFVVQGEVTAIQSLSVTLTNGEGNSAASSVQF